VWDSVSKDGWGRRGAGAGEAIGGRGWPRVGAVLTGPAEPGLSGGGKGSSFRVTGPAEDHGAHPLQDGRPPLEPWYSTNNPEAKLQYGVSLYFILSLGPSRGLRRQRPWSLSMLAMASGEPSPRSLRIATQCVVLGK